MEIRITIDDRKLMFILAVIISVSAIGLVVAYGGSNPPVVGHTWGEMVCDNTLCANTVNGNIGIGTTNPDAKLRIAGGGVKLDAGQTISAPGRLHIQAENENLYLNPWSGITYVGYGGGPGNLFVSGNVDIKGTIRGATYGFGGMYAIEDYGACRSVNPFTGSCSCPSDFNDMSTGAPVLDTYERWLFIHICYK